MGKSKQFGAIQQPDVPKYMRMEGNTQFELAQSIDAAMEAAENALKTDQEHEALFIWYEQVLDLIQEEFLLQKRVNYMTSNEGLAACIDELLPLCWAYYQSLQEASVQQLKASKSEAAFKLVMQSLLQRSFINTIDILNARNLWRFDIQRNMQLTQERLLARVEQFC